MTAEFELHQDTMFMAIEIVKRIVHSENDFQDCYIFPSLSLAAKMRELDCRTVDFDDPEFSVLPTKVGDLNRFTAENYREDEIYILKKFDWNLCIVTVYDYVAKFSGQALLVSDDSMALENSVSVVADMPSEQVQQLKRQITSDCQTIVFLLAKWTGSCLNASKIAFCVILMSRAMSKISKQK